MVKYAKLVDKYQVAPLWKRVFAYILDVFLVAFVLSVSFAKYFTSFESKLDILFIRNDPRFFWLSFVIVVSMFFYFSVLEYKTNQTIGKMLVNIYSVSLIGDKLTFSQAFIRNITKPFSIVLLVDTIYMFFKGGNRRLFEVFSGTKVVEKEMIVK